MSLLRALKITNWTRNSSFSSWPFLFNFHYLPVPILQSMLLKSLCPAYCRQSILCWSSSTTKSAGRNNDATSGVTTNDYGDPAAAVSRNRIEGKDRSCLLLRFIPPDLNSLLSYRFSATPTRNAVAPAVTCSCTSVLRESENKICKDHK